MSTNKDLSFIAQKSVSLQDFLIEFARRWFLYVAIILAGVIVSFSYAKFLITPLYDSTARLYIINKASQTINSSDFSISTYLTNDFSEIITDRAVLTKVESDLNNKFTVQQLKSYITVDVPESTRIIQVTARTPKPEDSKAIVNSVCKVSKEALVEIMGLDRVTVISEGVLPNTPSVPHTSNIVLIGFVFASFISIIVAYLFTITDNKISSSKDVEKYLGINVLATIPYNPNKQQKSKA